MRLLARPHQLPARLAAGALILNSGLTKSAADKETAAQLHGMASGAYPFLKDMDPEDFVKLLSKAEIAVGAALLIPAVPSVLAGAALTAFAGGLLGLYLRTPGMREEGSLRPTHQGMAIAKDVWLLGIGAGLVAEELRRC
ncbi:hypothetical protein [Planomonospora venezuelensis]|uniref:DoxX protein n=1 Tax=Planomonospora venezuelensis TaxID=1999 RepID=A0A841D6N4_PLAVE|nr:hypothetical protein [Planomonospora venezuelensis]MBB5963815.1 hypothetical protein [Planomonospora venezuelensis]GIM99601.1 hypothetical protein Pve01_12600 [Planomonospora venezuelensis]